MLESGVITTLRLLFARQAKGKRKLVLWRFCINYPKSARAECFHSIMDRGEKSFIHAHETQIVVICYVGLWANPCELLPKHSDEAVASLGWVQGESIIHEHA